MTGLAELLAEVLPDATFETYGKEYSGDELRQQFARSRGNAHMERKFLTARPIDGDVGPVLALLRNQLSTTPKCRPHRTLV